MGFPLADLIVESLIRDGVQNLRENPAIIDDIFSSLTAPYAQRKYGVSEVNKIKNIINSRELAIISAYHPGEAQLPCLSIALSDDMEDRSNATFNDYAGTEQSSVTDPAQLAALYTSVAFVPLTISASNVIDLPLSVDMSQILLSNVVVDSSNNQFYIGALVDTPTLKRIHLEDNQPTPAVGPLRTRSRLDVNVYNQHAIPERVKISVGIHTGEPLLTKYLYIILKYILFSRKKDAEARGLLVSTLTGSDFMRDPVYQGDIVYTRYIQIEGMIYSCWRQDQVQLVDAISIKALIPKQPTSDADLDRLDQTIRQKT